MTGHGWTRRSVLGGAGAAIAGAAGWALTGCSSSSAGPSTTRAAATSPVPARPGQAQSFVTRPDLTPPVMTVTHHAQDVPQQPRYFLTTTGQGGGQSGPMILDLEGRLVWFSPAPPGKSVLNFNTQTYRGQPVLTWWEGKVTNGHGAGAGVIADSSYNRLATVRAAGGLQTDLHEFFLTDQGTALITANRARPADLSGLGGPAKGTVLSGVAQEIDVATGKLVWEWDSLDHVGPADSYEKLSGSGSASNPYDYFHINSIDVLPDGDWLISARNTWAVYKVARPGGDIIWQLNGKKSSFDMGQGTDFYWQHDARWQGGNVVSLFDDGATPEEERQSRGLILDLDTTAMRATRKHQYVHPSRLLAAFMGSVQVLGDGRVFVGWGMEPYFSEFSEDGRLLIDGQFRAKDGAYRSFTNDWTGEPAGNPAVAARAGRGGGVRVYASWNGATQVSAWAVLAGRKRASLADIGSVSRTGFETEIAVHHPGPFFAVRALDRAGRSLGISGTVRAT
jgi:hypothetical protein